MINKYLVKLSITLLVTFWLIVGYQSVVFANDQHNKIALTALLKSYENALNESDSDKIVQLYTADGVFMPSSNATASGQAQLRTAYQHVFQALDLDVVFHIKDIEWQDNLAFVRTVSDGKITLLDKNITIKNNTRELFVMKRINQQWNIYRYMFNKASSVKQ